MIRIFWLGLLCLVLPNVATGEVVKGIYGVPSIAERDPSSYVGDMEKAGVNAVFVKPDRDTVKWFKDRGFQVFVSIDAYGGSRAWKQFPDSRPVLADGSLLGENPEYACHGGACPSHEGWQRERLSYIAGLIKDFEGQGLFIDGIWLDYIRYPGRWSVLDPKIPDTCYCERCLGKFSKEMGIEFPIGFSRRDAKTQRREEGQRSDVSGWAVEDEKDGMIGWVAGSNTKEVSRWIKENCPYEWMVWKKRQINGFVEKVRGVLNEKSPDRRPLLGIFLVPWTKGERGNGVSYSFAQDGFELAKYADVISPMVYHKKVGRSEAWVGVMTRYYEERVSCEVWPIVQAMDCTVEEFAAVMRYAGEGGADGVLGFPFRAVEKAGLWEGFRGFNRAVNLLKSTDYVDYSDKKVRGLEGEKVSEESGVIEIRPEYGECGEWVVPLRGCEAGVVYEFRGEFWQRVWENGAYPMVLLWGREFLLNTHWKSKVFQPLRVYVRCPGEVRDQTFRFKNCNPEKEIRMRNPELRRFYGFAPEPGVPLKRDFFDEHFFPIGVYGANLKNLEEIKKLAINTVVLGGTGKKLREQVEKCHEVGLRYVLSTPHDPDRLPVYLDQISGYVRPYDMAFYVNDEPGIHSFPTGKAVDVNRLIKERFPDCATCMAIVRPQVCGEYKDGADFFMLDQYPVPFMPFGWLSDSMDYCAACLGSADYADYADYTEKKVKGLARGRLAAVIQAFGGETRFDHPRLPTWQEMDCLAFLSVVHGSRGIFFYTYSWIGKTEEGRERLGRVVGRLNQVYPWLVVENSGEKVGVEMLSGNRFDPKGRAAVQCCLKRKGDELMVFAVNTIGTGVECLLEAEKVRGLEGKKVSEVFSGEDYVVRDGKIRVRLGPYGVKAFIHRLH